MHYLDAKLSGRKPGMAYTHRKGRLELQFLDAGEIFLLSWEKQGNQAILTTSTTASLPRKRVEVLRDISSQTTVRSVQIHSKDRLLKIDLDQGDQIILGFYPGAENVYLLRSGSVQESFLKNSNYPSPTDEWLTTDDPLPETIPGEKVSREQLQNARTGISMDWDRFEIRFGAHEKDPGLSISDFVLNVLRNAARSKQVPVVSLQKVARTLLKRWKSKVGKIAAELEEAQTWSSLQEKLDVLKIALGLGLKPEGGKLVIPPEYSSSMQVQKVELPPDITVSKAIETTAKKIRKFQTKLIQLEDVYSSVQEDIQSLETLLVEPDESSLRDFLESHGEALDQAGKQKTERKPYKRYRSPSGFDILVGRTSQDNDTLTLKIASKNDWWFHARQVRGSHVILRTGNHEPSQDDILAAARHAALKSKSKHSGLVVVQYCQRKHLSKPKGSHPGTVLVHQERSVTVDLD